MGGGVKSLIGESSIGGGSMTASQMQQQMRDHNARVLSKNLGSKSYSSLEHRRGITGRDLKTGKIGEDGRVHFASGQHSSVRDFLDARKRHENDVEEQNRARARYYRGF